MKIIVISETTVKISLTKEELSKLDLNFDSLSEDSYKAKLFFSVILSATGFVNFKNAFVEVFDLRDEGCVIYISKIPDKHIMTAAFVTIETKKPEQLLHYAKKLVGLFKNSLNSSLYNHGDSYRLVVKYSGKPDSELKKFISNKFVRVSFDRLTAELTCEHSEVWKILISQNALEKLSELS